jgi:hypothetical protein
MTAPMLAPDDVKPATALPGHFGVSEVIRGAGAALRRAFPTSLWVKGEVSDYRAPTQGHHYFNLVERQQGGSQSVLPCAVWWLRLLSDSVRGASARADGGAGCLPGAGSFGT